MTAQGDLSQFLIFNFLIVIQNSSYNADGEWAVREIFVATITTNLASVIPLFRRWLSLGTGTETGETFYLKSTATAAEQRARVQRVEIADGDTTLVNSQARTASPSHINRKDVSYSYPAHSGQQVVNGEETRVFEGQLRSTNQSSVSQPHVTRSANGV